VTPGLSACLEDAFARLARGVADRRSAFHVPTLATVSPDGAPEARSLVLRGFDAAARSLRLHTDARSGKVASLRAEPRCELHLYDADAGVQVRLTGRATVHGDDRVARMGWEGSRAPSRKIYSVEPGPGTPVAAPPAAPEDTEAGRAVFRVILLGFDRLEWLDLDAAGHRRARFEWHGDAPVATWLVP